MEKTLDRFHISATGLSMNYMPEYLAVELGYFEQLGLKVTSYVPHPWTTVLTDINTNQAEAVVGGIWCPLIYKRRAGDYYAFAKVASRCPMSLLSHEPVENFTWSDLEGKKVLTSGGNGASPGLYLAGIAGEGGADVSKIHFIHDFTIAMLQELFIGGFGDVIMIKSDLASQLEAQGKGYVLTDLTITGGAVPWSVYYTTPETLADQRNLCGRFTQGLQMAQTWLREHDGYDCREILQRNWPKVELEKAIAIIDEYKVQNMWPETVRIQEDELNRWQRFLVSGHVIDDVIPYDEIVDSKPFDYAAVQLGLKKD
ncbi:MAG: ABC transporter substrate-binding protein [Clostridiales bacterium]|nr:ABC transporter substrate-binding protein [Clostridiales bacterium]